MLAHAKVEGLETTVGEEAVKCGGNSTDRVLQECELGKDGLVRGDGNTHYDIRVSVNILCDRVDNDISAERKRILEERAHESVIDDQLGVMLVCNIRNSLDVNKAQGGVGRSFDPDKLGVWANDRGDIAGIGKVNESDLNSENRGNLGKITVGATVNVVHRDDVRSSGEGADNSRSGSRSRGEGQSVLGTLKSSDGGLESMARGVSTARVVESLWLE